MPTLEKSIQSNANPFSNKILNLVYICLVSKSRIKHNY